jgi:hypothetical protein
MPRRQTPALVWVVAAAVTGFLPLPARGQTPTPLSPALFSFPGSVASPASAASAGLALADRWLGEEPFANPAGNVVPRIAASGTMLHVSRQDLRADNRNYDETAAFFDGAGLVGRLPSLGPLDATVYAFQPVLRREDNVFSRGTATPDPANPPALIESHASQRELRAGLAASVAVGPGRLGLGAEWTRREDAYQTVEHSGNPQSGTSRLDLSGDGFGLQAGARLDRGDSSAGAFRVGLGVRYLPALDLEASHSEAFLIGTSKDTLHLRREAGWEAGTSASVVVSPAFRALAAFGGRTAQRWDALDQRSGRGWEWKLGGVYHDPIEPWTFRFGLGQERQSGVPEPRANVLGLGFGWQLATATIDLGVTHRTLSREGSPNSFDDRIVLTIGTRP